MLAPRVLAQDIHFSQFFHTPLASSPGNIGAFDGDYRVHGIFRQQWRAVTQPYRTFGLGYDAANAFGKPVNKHAGPDGKEIYRSSMVLKKFTSGQGQLSQPDVCAVSATTFPWHGVSVKILQRAGLRHVGWREHEMLGDLQVFERRRDVALARSYRELAVAASF